MRKKHLTAGLAAIVMVVCAVLLIQSPLASTTITTARVGVDQGAARMYVANGGSCDVESGGYIDFQSGASLKIAGTAVTSTAAELNVLHSVTPGTAAASKAVVLGADSKIDSMDITSLKINGVQASTAGAVQSFCITGACTETSSTNGGAVAVDKFQTLVSAAGAETRTLAVPGSNGLMKVILMTVHGGNVTMAGTNVWGAEAQTCTFSDVGHSMVLISAGGKWVVLKLTGVVCA